MIEQHANNHADRIRFPPNQGKDYIIERSKYTKMAYGRLQQNWQNAEDAVNSTYLYILEYPPKKEMDEESFERFFTVVLMGVIGRMYRNDRSKERNSVTDLGKYAQYLEVEENEDDMSERREEIIAIADEDTNPEIVALSRELLASIEREIYKLKFKPKQIVAMNVLYGYKPREIQAITGDSKNTIWSAIKRFRHTMEGVLT